MSRGPTIALATASATTPLLDNKLLKQFMKAYLEAHMPGQTEVDPKPCKQPLKLQFPDFNYGNLHIDRYRFYQQCKNHFKTVEAKKPNRILFAALFLRKLITQRWLQHKQRRNGAV